MWSHSRAENMRLRGEIDNLRSDLERANQNLDFAFQVSLIAYRLSITVRQPVIFSGICTEFRIRHRENRKENDGNQTGRDKRTNPGRYLVEI